ncbi:hypothetical protein ACM64Y_07010 [Novispirillum sp. DQ9]|uniref:hypothetical protein n=1 Tax=Novispirillum sp. DQ9 TaxID=3398612 RepID=UPI003C7A3EBB
MTVSSLPRPAAPPSRPAVRPDTANDNDNREAPSSAARFTDHRPALRRNAPPPLPLALLCAEIIP